MAKDDIQLTISLPEMATIYLDRLRLLGFPAGDGHADICRYLIIRALDDMSRQGVFRRTSPTLYQGHDDD